MATFDLKKLLATKTDMTVTGVTDIDAASHPTRPGRSTITSSSFTPTDSAEPFYDEIEPPPSPVDISRDVVLPVRASRNRVSTTLKYFLWLTGLTIFTVVLAVIVGALLYVHVSGKSVCKINK